MTIERKLLGTTPVSGEVLPEAVSFDGSSDYLSRSSDMTGNADGKTFTFSCWVYPNGDIRQPLYSFGSGSTWFKIEVEAGGKLAVYFEDGTVKYSLVIDGGIPDHTFSHVMVAFDGDTQANCQMYVNEINESYTTNTFVAGTLIQFADTNHAVGAIAKYASINADGRLSHVFLDYTYRDLSIESNRRLFIDADGKPSSTIPSSPILYLPMTDAATAGSNSGTGGDFTVNGVLATAERGPNQDNCSASNFATAADTLLRSDNQGWVATKTITCSFTVDTLSANNNIYGAFAPSERVKIKVVNSTLSATFNSAANGNDSVRFILTNDLLMHNKNSHITFSFDASDTSKRHLYVNGEAMSANWLDFNNTNLQMNNVTKQYINSTNSSGDNGTNTNIGEFYMANAYYDLSADNPFWDSDANRPNSVRKVIADTGVTPLIALPLIGSDAGNNLGSGGDFTVNSGPFVGARGGSEFWARSADFNGGSNSYLRGNSGASSDPSDITLVLFFTTDTNTNTRMLFEIANSHAGTGDIGVDIRLETGGQGISIAVEESDNSILYETGYYSLNSTLGFQHYLLLSLSSTQQKASFYVDGVLADNATSLQGSGNVNVGGYMTTTIGHSIGAGGVNSHDGEIGFLYFDSSYIDFSQEANRNKFIDQLGYPIDLGADGSEPTGSSPNIYMKFDPTVSLGTNSGSGNNFSVNGTITAGSDVTP